MLCVCVFVYLFNVFVYFCICGKYFAEEVHLISRFEEDQILEIMEMLLTMMRSGDKDPVHHAVATPDAIIETTNV